MCRKIAAFSPRWPIAVIPAYRRSQASDPVVPEKLARQILPGWKKTLCSKREIMASFSKTQRNRLVSRSVHRGSGIAGSAKSFNAKADI
jgi:hypothetical protein